MSNPVAFSANDLVSQSIEKLRQLSQVDILTSWQYCTADLPIKAVTPTEFSPWSVAQLNHKGHITWPGGGQVIWLAQQLIIPQQCQAYPITGLTLRLALTWWAEKVEIFVNGQPVQQGDLFDYFTRVLLSPAVDPGAAITVALRLVSPGHCEGGLMRSLCLYESNHDDYLEPGFVADELAVLQRYLETFAPENLSFLAEAIEQIEWDALADAERFDHSLSTLRQTLLTHQQLKLKFPTSTLFLLGHSHLDMAWLWPVKETWDVAQRTFESVLQLQQDFPNLIFCHSTPALYAWIEQHRPDLFTAIQRQIAAGVWEVVGGMWVEPDLNLIAGESIVRQILYGQRYGLEKFGQLSQVAWLPDSFGFSATLPQFLKQGGIEYFVTQKLRWNDTTKFPYEVFQWQSPDGSQILSWMSGLIGEGIDPIKMVNYACEWQSKTQLIDALWLFGVGDHGGGPTRDMLEVGKRWQKSPFFPKLESSTAQAYLQQLSHQFKQSQTGDDSLSQNTSWEIPIWQDELYLEFHRGCYTTHADQKRWNRRCEGLLYQAELFASLATLIAGIDYPQTELEMAWKKVLFNQFHDILPGTSIPEVFIEANQAWQEVEQVGSEILASSLNAIASRITLPPPPQPDAFPIIVFNPLNWSRSEVVAVPLPDGEAQNWQLYDWEGQPLASQGGGADVAYPSSATSFKAEKSTPRLLFWVKDIPSIGYRVFWLGRQKAEKADGIRDTGEKELICTDPSHSTITLLLYHSSCLESTDFKQKDWFLENEFLRVIVDAETGNLSSIWDKIEQREILHPSGGNQLQAFQDSGQYWDAWNIDPNYHQHPLPPPQLKSIQYLEQGIIQTRLRVVRQLGNSEFQQDYLLQTESPLLKIATTVNWQEQQVLVKAAFPLNLEAEEATYEIPCGTIQHPTQPETPAEKAKWEIPALRWADLTQVESASIYGVSLLNDCKYGYDSQPNQLRLTLLRSPNWPEAKADIGNHEFTYALYPHRGTWQSAHTVRRGYELNVPLQVKVLSSGQKGDRIPAPLPPVGKFLDFSADNLILMAFKQSEDDPHQWILRCYECHGETAQLQLQSDLGFQIIQPVDLLERPMPTSAPLSQEQTVKISPWTISSFLLKPGSGLTIIS